MGSFTAHVGKRPLTWAPPTLVSPIYLYVTETTNRYLTLTPGQDYVVVLPSTALSGQNPSNGWGGLRISLGRNIHIIGGQITIPSRGVGTTLSADIGASDTTIPVASTAGYASIGGLRVQGELIKYTGKTSTSFTGCTRNAGFVFSPGFAGAHVSGTAVYPDQDMRTGMYLLDQTGTVHVEGVLFDGPDLSEVIRVESAAGTYQFQNCRNEPLSVRDPVNFTDNHPDCIQIIKGPAALRTDRCTFHTNSQGIFNKGSDLGSICNSLDHRNTQVVGVNDVPNGLHNGYLWYDFDGAAVSNYANCWGASRTGSGLRASGPKANLIQEGRPLVDMCPASVPGLAYQTPGYV